MSNDSKSIQIPRTGIEGSDSPDLPAPPTLTKSSLQQFATLLALPHCLLPLSTPSDSHFHKHWLGHAHFCFPELLIFFSFEVHLFYLITKCLNFLNLQACEGKAVLMHISSPSSLQG
jgi:hypothetical protein